MKKKRGLIFIISGPSGSGKTTLTEKVVREKTVKGKLAKPVSFTTRPKRSGEKGARDYFFLTEKQFREQLRAKKFLEWTKYLGYYYATPRDAIERRLARGEHIILCVDLKGAARIKHIFAQNSTTIFILPPSLAELKERIKNRCHKTKGEEIRRRIKLAKQEIAAASRYDYHLVNKNLGQVTQELKKIILKKIKTFKKGR